MKARLFSPIFALTFVLFVAAFTNVARAQVARQAVVEHFTNTRCGVCASKNPAFYTTLGGYPSVIHIAYHPSSPYSNCFFSQQNPTENDARTNYYGLYGGTPQIAIEGKAQAATTPTIKNVQLDTVLGKTSPIGISLTMQLIGSDSVKVRSVIRTYSANNYGTLKTFVAVTQDLVNYSAPNGETVHHDVFRKALTNAVGNTFTVPTVGDSLVQTFRFKIELGWSIPHLNVVGLVQHPTNLSIINANKQTYLKPATVGTFGIGDTANPAFRIYPNPVTNYLQIIATDPATSVYSLEISDLAGRTVLRTNISNASESISLSGLHSGMYLVKVQTENDSFVAKIIKE